MRKFHIKTFGCQMNELDSEIIRSMLEERGFVYSENPENAEIILINTCTVREKAARKAKHLLRFYKNRGKFVGVLGCLAQQEGEKLLKYGADIVVGTRGYNELPKLLCSMEDKAVVCQDLGLHYTTKRKALSHSEYVSIQYGCDNFCTFCVVPYTRGREISRPAEEILEEVKNLDRQGVVEITLLGQNVNSYFDGKYDFADLLRMIE
ncbi:MAG: radical SAM protein, partial [Candidatus Caldipriscus sp.]